MEQTARARSHPALIARATPALLAVLVLACGGTGSDASTPLSAAVASAAQPPVASPPRATVPSGDSARPSHVAVAASTVASRRTAITDAVAHVAPSVVTVQTEVEENAPLDPFDAFFGATPTKRVLPGLGSGIILRPDGVIVTNAHVVAGATTISVALRDGTTYPAKLLGKDEINDLAVLKINAKNLPVATLGNSDSLLIGEWAIAIGNPYGFLLGNSEPSVTAGVISGTGRNLGAQTEGGALYVDMIQTDAAINPGNSGGPLVDALGEVIGVNSSIYTPSGGSVGLGFAIPINRVKRVTEDLLAHGAIRRPWLGLKIELPRSGNSRQALRAGVHVRSVEPGSPAAKAGIEPGDQLLRAGNRALHNPFDWEAEKLELRVGQRVPLLVRRGSRKFSVSATVADLPEVSAPKVEVLKELELVTVTPAIRAEKGIRSRHGALVYKVSDRVSKELGIEVGDVIVQLNQTRIDNAQEVAKVLRAYNGRGGIRMYFERGGGIYFTDFTVQ
ncbi:MAG TPA: trypsin-like peptidase domain-containing protein [Gemmatimonadaceae bacterium]|nr:trypsin-like peptidase domain-containing protein [Gemmatimonadaceae bacterium]